MDIESEVAPYALDGSDSLVTVRTAVLLGHASVALFDGRRLSVQNTRRVADILRALDNASRPEDMNLPGFRFHAIRWSMPPDNPLRAPHIVQN